MKIDEARAVAWKTKTRIENLKEVHRIDYHAGKFEDCKYCKYHSQEVA